MYAIAEISAAVRSRRSDMGLTQTAVSKLSGLSRATVNQVENGTIKDLSITRTAKLLSVLGLSLTVSPARQRSHEPRGSRTSALEIAARTASVSYRHSLSSEELSSILLTGEVPPSFMPHVNALLEDASVSLLASVVEQLHASNDVERAHLWARMREIARRLGSRRDIWQ